MESGCLTPAKLFPRVATASIAIVFAADYFLATCRANPGVVLTKPSWESLPTSQVALAALLVQTRRGKRRKRMSWRRRRRSLIFS